MPIISLCNTPSASGPLSAPRSFALEGAAGACTNISDGALSTYWSPWVALVGRRGGLAPALSFEDFSQPFLYICTD